MSTQSHGRQIMLRGECRCTTKQMSRYLTVTENVLSLTVKNNGYLKSLWRNNFKLQCRINKFKVRNDYKLWNETTMTANYQHYSPPITMILIYEIQIFANELHNNNDWKHIVC